MRKEGNKMKTILYKITLLIILTLVIFILPTENIIRNLIIYVTHINNVYFDILVKLAIFLLVIFIYELDIKNSIEYGKIYKFRTQKFERNPIKYIVIATLGSEALITIILRILDLSKRINISSETWVNYISSILGITLTAFGIIITLNKYFKDKEEKESPKLKILSVNKPEKIDYCCKIDNDYTNNLKHKIYIKLINKGDTAILSPNFRDEYNNIYEIEQKNVENQILYQIDPYEQENKDKYIVELELSFNEGMSERVYKCIDLIYNNKDYNEYMTTIRIKFNRKDGKNISITCDKQLRNYDRILGMG